MKKDVVPNLGRKLADYHQGEEIPPCVFRGQTEGEAMSEGDIENWVLIQIKTLSIIREDYPERFEALYGDYVRDLEYLGSIGKISEEQILSCKDRENFSFGQTE